LKKAIDIVSDKDFVEFDVLTAPGVTNSTLNNAVIDACEDRADALAIIDIEGGYQPPHERNTSTTGETSTTALGSVSDTVDNLKTMGINSSYGCAFYPWVKVRDNVNNAMLYVPPSVVALGTFSSSQRKSEVWFAPAGFTRGGLSEGSAGLPVIGVRQRLTSADRDKLYDANVNPIASFPAEGIVVFGQKTLQVTPSALDRINVRRLLIHVKKEISRISSTLLFEQNVQATWERFLGEVVPFLDDIKAGLGLADFKVVLDDTTTTPDLIDRNIMYAKIFLKPARAIEFIALDFIITRSGASFDD
jgi:phage tail sheath protein FI